MRKMKFAMLAALAALLCVGLGTGACRASTIHVESYPGLSGIGVTGYNGTAGEFQVGVNSVTVNAAAYCVDFSKTITVPGTYGNYTLESASSQSTAYQVGAWILSQYAPGLGQTSWYSGVTGATTAVAQAAVQFAIWEVTQETSGSALYNLLNGTFRVTSDGSNGIATTLANNILLAAYNTLYSQSSNSYVVSADSISNISLAKSGTTQNLLVGSPVPIPPSVFLLGSGLAGLGLFRMRFKKR